VGLESHGGVLGRGVPPQEVNESIRRDDLVGPEKKDGEHPALLGAA